MVTASKLKQMSHSQSIPKTKVLLLKDISRYADPGGGVRASYEYDEESEDDLKREEGISFPPDTGPLGASGRSISLDPGALAGN